MAFLYSEVRTRHASDVRPTQRVFAWSCTLGIEHRFYINILLRLLLPSPVATTNLRHPKCSSKTYRLAISTIFSDVCTPLPLDPTYMYINPFIGNTYWLTFDLTIAYYFCQLITAGSCKIITKHTNPQRDNYFVLMNPIKGIELPQYHQTLIANQC